MSCLFHSASFFETDDYLLGLGGEFLVIIDECHVFTIKKEKYKNSQLSVYLTEGLGYDLV